jgi:hypothetical protein
MFARYLKAQALVFLFGGIVGPIFLIVFFAMGPSTRPYIGWMFYVGLLITAADVLIALWLANFNAKSAATTAALEQNGVLALARITGMGETNMQINDRQVMVLNLHIEGPGITPFDAKDQVIAHVTRQMNLSKGRLVVLVDPTTHKFQIDWERSGLVNGLVPAQITIAEDNRTYDLTGQVEPLMEILRMLKSNGIPLNDGCA